MELIRAYEEHPHLPEKQFGPAFDWHNVGKLLEFTTGIDLGVVRQRLRGNFGALGPGGRPLYDREVIGGTAIPGPGGGISRGLARELDEWVAGAAKTGAAKTGVVRTAGKAATGAPLKIVAPGVRRLKPNEVFDLPGSSLSTSDLVGMSDRTPALYWPEREALIMGLKGGIHSEIAQALSFFYKVPPHMTFNGVNERPLSEILAATKQIEYWQKGGFLFGGHREILPERWVLPGNVELTPSLTKLLQDAHNAPIHEGLATQKLAVPKRKMATGGVAGGDNRAMQLVRAYENMPADGGHFGPPVPSLKTLGKAALGIVGIDPGVVRERMRGNIFGTLGPGGRGMRPGEVAGGVGPFGRLPKGLANILGREAEAYLGFWKIAQPRMTRRERAVQDAIKGYGESERVERRMYGPDIRSRADVIASRAALKAVGQNFPDLAGKMQPRHLMLAQVAARESGAELVPGSRSTAEFFVDELLRLGRGQAPLVAPARREAASAAAVKARIPGLQTAKEIAAEANPAGVHAVREIPVGEVVAARVKLGDPLRTYKVWAHGDGFTRLLRMQGEERYPNAKPFGVEDSLSVRVRHAQPGGRAGSFIEKMIASELQPVLRTPSQLQDILARRFAGGGIAEVPKPRGFMAGGLVGGTDTVPAMLTPGELVISRPQRGRLEGGTEIAARQRNRMLDEERKQTQLLTRIEQNQRAGDPQVARLSAKLHSRGVKNLGIGHAKRAAVDLTEAGVTI